MVNEVIPKQLQQPQFRFIKVMPKDKFPKDKEWTTTNNYAYDDPELLKWIEDGGNYGVVGGYGGLVVIDYDNKDIQDKHLPNLPNTFTVKASELLHTYFISKEPVKSFKYKNEKGDTLLDIQATGKMVMGAGSIHPKGMKYQVVNDMPIAEIDLETIKEEFKDYEIVKPQKRKGLNAVETDPVMIEIKKKINLIDVLNHYGVDTSRNPTTCPMHSYKKGSNLSFDENVWNCFNCDKNGNMAHFIMEMENCNFVKAKEKLMGLSGVEVKKEKEFTEKKEEIGELEKFKGNKKGKGILDVFSKRGQLETFWQTQPFYYDESKIFWIWDKENFKWVISDEINFCNSLFKELHIDTISTKEKTEFVEGFKQVGRMHKPRDPEKTWVQFRSKIYDVKNDLCFDATPEYFMTNPIPWDVGESEDTPTIDGYFDDWIQGQDPSWKKTLYEIIAYNLSSNKFMQRVFALVGGGSNGKGSYIKLNYKFLGEGNHVTSEMKKLSENRFEPFVIYKKLLCVMGEVSPYDLNNTNVLKQLGGEDRIGFEKKGKTPFSDENTATCICLTNSMPITPDKTTGFYRKWLIVDFLNQFKEINKSLIDDIPDEEFENLAKKSLRILKELYETQKFTNEGNFDEREKRYEERSNPVMKFIDEHCEEIEDTMLILRDFVNACNEWMAKNHYRKLNSKQIGRILRNEGFTIGSRKIEGGSSVVISNLKITQLPLIPLIPSKNPLSSYKGSISDFNGNNGNNGLRHSMGSTGVEGSIGNEGHSETEPKMTPVSECEVCGLKTSDLVDGLCELCRDNPNVCKGCNTDVSLFGHTLKGDYCDMCKNKMRPELPPPTLTKIKPKYKEFLDKIREKNTIIKEEFCDICGLPLDALQGDVTIMKKKKWCEGCYTNFINKNKEEK